MSSIRPRRPLSDAEEPCDDALARDWTLTPGDVTETLRGRGDHHRLRFAIQLCWLRANGRFVEDYQCIPLAAVNHLARQLELPPVLFLPNPGRSATETAQRQRVRNYLDFHSFDAGAEQHLRTHLQERAAEGVAPNELLPMAEQLLHATRVVAPARATLERMVASVTTHVARDLFAAIAAKLPDEFRLTIDELIEVPEGDHRSPLGRLKEAAPDAKAPAIAAAIARYDLLEMLLGSGIDLSDVSAQLRRHLAQLARRYDAAALRRFVPAKRHALVAAFLVERRQTLLDQIVTMHDQYMTALARKARNAFDRKHRALRRQARNGVGTLLGAVETFLTIDRSATVGKLFETVSEAALQAAVTSCRALEQLEQRGEAGEHVVRYGDLRKYWPAFLELPFEAAAGCEQLLVAIETARALNKDSSEALLDSAPRHFMPAAWRSMFFQPSGRPRRALWEITLAYAVRDALRSGDLFLTKSRRHVSFWNLVMSERQWAEARSDAYAQLGAPICPNEAVAALRVALDATAEAAADGLPDNPFAVIRDGELKLRQPDTLLLPRHVRELRNAIGSSLPQVRLEDLLQQVDQRCGFSRAFIPLGGYEPRSESNYRTLLAALIAHGTNLGVAAMSGSVEGITPDQLYHTSRWFLREATLKTANKIVVDHHHRLSFSRVWGDGSVSSSDGQRFAVQGRSLVTALYPRYFGYYDRAVTLYTHVSDQHSVFATQVISCAPREATYVLDGLLENDTLLRPQIHTTDTHGFTEQLFGLCYLLGLDFLPRFKDLPDQHLYRMGKGRSYGALDPLFRSTTNTALIAEQWDQLVRIAASLKQRTVPAHIVLQRLINASPADRVAKALTALCRIRKTIFILRYIQNEPLRRIIQRQLNRGEARHALARWLFFANHGEFRTGDYEEIMNKASCLSLLSNIAVLWNTIHMERIVHASRAAGDTISNEDLTHVWPLQHKRIIPNGTYFIGWPSSETTKLLPVTA